MDRSRKRVRVEDTDEGVALREKVEDLKALVRAYQSGTLKEQPREERIW